MADFVPNGDTNTRLIRDSLELLFRSNPSRGLERVKTLLPHTTDDEAKEITKLIAPYVKTNPDITREYLIMCQERFGDKAHDITGVRLFRCSWHPQYSGNSATMDEETKTPILRWNNYFDGLSDKLISDGPCRECIRKVEC